MSDEQKQKLQQIGKDMRAKQAEVFGAMRQGGPDQRGEAGQKVRKIREDADNQALEVLTAQQKGEFQQMQGKKFELRMERRRR